MCSCVFIILFLIFYIYFCVCILLAMMACSFVCCQIWGVIFTMLRGMIHYMYCWFCCHIFIVMLGSSVQCMVCSVNVSFCYTSFIGLWELIFFCTDDLFVIFSMHIILEVFYFCYLFIYYNIKLFLFANLFQLRCSLTSLFFYLPYLMFVLRW